MYHLVPNELLSNNKIHYFGHIIRQNSLITNILEDNVLGDEGGCWPTKCVEGQAKEDSNKRTGILKLLQKKWMARDREGWLYRQATSFRREWANNRFFIFGSYGSEFMIVASNISINCLCIPENICYCSLYNVEWTTRLLNSSIAHLFKI